MIAVAGRKLNLRLGIGAKHALYRETGNFYNCLKKFPGVLFDRYGHIIFETREQYENCPKLRIGKRLDVPGGIASIPGYVRVPELPAMIEQLA